MAITLTSGTSTIPVNAILGYSSSQDSGNYIYKVMGTGEPSVKLDYLGLRKGSLTILCDSFADAIAKRNQLAIRGVQRLVDTDVPEASMYFVIDGSVDVEVSEYVIPGQAGFAATVKFGYQEVTG